ncbi:hypothetical protein FACS189429_8290 [Bacteroidia bacterium]|nr:hypothetical protein FACS189429_8290 [Bacteroidia bacterium]
MPQVLQTQKNKIAVGGALNKDLIMPGGYSALLYATSVNFVN